MNAIIVFAIATVVNITLSTIRSICTIKSGKWISAITNAVCYGFYPLIVMLTAKGTVDIVMNMGITAIANFVCVWIIKFIEEKARKDKLWRVEMTVNTKLADKMHNELNYFGISHYWINAGKHTVFNVFCPTQKESAFVKHLADKHHAKYFVSESKTL